MGIPHLYTEMNATKIEYLIMHLRHNSDLGKLFSINLNWLQMQSGISTPILEYDKPITYLDNWFTHLHKFLQKINAKIQLKNTYRPVMEREHDCCIMDSILTCSVVLSKNQLRHVNNWRSFFKVMKLSDITNTTGDCILPVYLTFPTGDIVSDRKSKLHWQRQDRPTCLVSFKLWLKCICTCFLQGRSQNLSQALGRWILSYSKSESTWPVYIHNNHQSCILCSDSGFRQYSTIRRTTSCTTTFTNISHDVIDGIYPPDHYFPASSTIQDDLIIVSHFKQHMIICSQNDNTIIDNDMVFSIQRSSIWKKHLLQHIHISDPTVLKSIIQDSEKTLLVVSDGGLREGKGSCGVSIGTFDLDLVSIEGPAPGNSLLLTSFCSEAYGLLAAISFLNLYVQTYHINIPMNCVIRLYTDNLGLVKWIQEILDNQCYSRMYIRSEADVILQIQSEMSVARQLNSLLKIEHVKGHQDEIIPFNELSWQAQLNVRADLFATNYLKNGVQHSYQELCNNPVSFYINGEIITRDVRNKIRSASISSSLRKYLIKKYKWHENTPDEIWWRIHSKALKSFSKADQRRLIKHNIQWLPTCERLNMCDPDTTAFCQSCAPYNVVETHNHLLWCSCYNRSVVKHKWLYDLDVFLRNERYTPPIIQSILYNHLVYVCYPDRIKPTLPECDNLDIQRATSSQEKIGWRQLLYGRISILWGTMIGNQLEVNHVSDIEMTMDRWGITFVKLMYQLILDIWESRNQDGHMVNDRNESQLSRQRILDKIVALQESNPEVRYSDRDFIFCPIEILEKYSLANLVSWHKSACSILKAQKKYRGPQQSICDSFQTIPRPTIQSVNPPDPPPAPNLDPALPFPPPAPNLASVSQS